MVTEFWMASIFFFSLLQGGVSKIPVQIDQTGAATQTIQLAHHRVPAATTEPRTMEAGSLKKAWAATNFLSFTR